MAEHLSDKNPCHGCTKPAYYCDRCEEYDNYVKSLEKKLKEYETAEDEGRVLILPCKPGDKVYEICTQYTECAPYEERFDESSCCGCEVECDSQKEYIIKEHIIYAIEEIARHITCGNWGKKIFSTREDAKRSLKEMRMKIRCQIKRKE